MKQQHSIDGFVPRRPGAQTNGKGEPARPVGEVNRFYPGSLPSPDQPVASRRPELGISRSDLDDSLRGIDAPEEKQKGRSRRKKGEPKSKKRRIIKWVCITLVVILLSLGGWVLYKAMHAGGNVFKGSILDIIQNQPLKQDENGRSNILVVGTSQDDPGHQAGYLTDSMMIVSVDQKNKNAYMISIPRDLEVHYGQSCISGNSGKINVYYSCVGGGTDNVESDRAALTKEAAFVGDIMGLDVQYGVNVNYTVMRELINAVGGSITVNIEGDGSVPYGIAAGSVMDSNFDWKCGSTRAKRMANCAPRGHFIDYGPGPATLDAEHALYLAQARGDSEPTWGLARSNFDREKNQQKIVKAIREKALSAGVLANFTKVTGVIDALGNNLRSTFETSEVRTLVSLAKDIKNEDIQSISLIDGDSPVMNGNAQPTAGMYEFGPLKAYIKKKLSSDPVVREEAKIVVLNGSGVAGVGLTEANSLEAKGFTITDIDNAPAGTYASVEIYQIGKGMSATKAKLESMYKVKVKTTAPPVDVVAGTNFVVIVGKESSSKN